MKRISLAALFALCAISLLVSQTVYEPVTDDIYHFLDRMEAMEVITGYRDVVKPMSREVLAGFLIQIDASSSSLSNVDRDQLTFYKEEYYQELQRLGYKNLTEERWHVYKYQSDPATINLDLVGRYTYHSRADGKDTKVRSTGAMAYGNVGKDLGAYFYFKDNHESGSYLNPNRVLTPIPAEVPSIIQGTEYFEYTTIEAQINVDWGFLTLTVEKDHNQWGTGENGTIILSDKAPSYPQIKIHAKLGKDIDFTYLHGWLYSGLIDSARSYYPAGLPKTEYYYRRIYIQKYIAAHMIEMTPWKGIDLSLGESEIYGGRNPELLYLIPIMFFKGAEHYMGDEDNAQLFLNADLNVIKNYNFYLSLFVDEISVANFYKTDKQHNQLAFTVGTKAYDTFIPNSEFIIEYTRLNPWVYNHKYPDATFQSHSVDLGHWLGQNGDMLFTKFSYQPERDLKVGFQFESIRKGGKESTEHQYELPSPEFLYGPLMKSQSFGITARYEPFRGLVFIGNILRSRYSDQSTLGVNDYAGKWDIFMGIRYNIY